MCSCQVALIHRSLKTQEFGLPLACAPTKPQLDSGNLHNNKSYTYNKHICTHTRFVFLFFCNPPTSFHPLCYMLTFMPLNSPRLYCAQTLLLAINQSILHEAETSSLTITNINVIPTINPPPLFLRESSQTGSSQLGFCLCVVIWTC